MKKLFAAFLISILAVGAIHVSHVYACGGEHEADPAKVEAEV